jgi:hypothetical protein
MIANTEMKLPIPEIAPKTYAREKIMATKKQIYK